jgi:hypothetical protein
MEPYSIPPGDAWRLGRGPFAFFGAPRKCAGEIDLINESASRVMVRWLPVEIFEGQEVTNVGVASMAVGVAVPPHMKLRTRAFFQLDSRVHPGNYRAVVLCGTQREEATIRVSDDTRLRFEPNVIQLRGGREDVLESAFVVINEGNVSETVDKLALAYLEEWHLMGRATVEAMRSTENGAGYQAYLDNLVAEIKRSMPQPARVELKAAAAELRPGESREVDLKMTLPSDLNKNRTYLGFAKFMSGRLQFRVECNGGNTMTRRPQ